MNETKRWHVTHQGSEKMPMVWKLEGRQVILFGLSLGLGIFLFRGLVDLFEWGAFNAGLVALIPPLVVLVIVLTLVKGKPRRHYRRWLEWQIAKARSESLLSERPNHFREFLERRDGRFIAHSKSRNTQS